MIELTEAERAAIEPVLAAAEMYAAAYGPAMAQLRTAAEMTPGRLTVTGEVGDAAEAHHRLELTIALALARAMKEQAERDYQSWRFDHAQEGGWNEEDIAAIENVTGVTMHLIEFWRMANTQRIEELEAALREGP